MRPQKIENLATWYYEVPPRYEQRFEPFTKPDPEWGNRLLIAAASLIGLALFCLGYWLRGL